MDTDIISVFLLYTFSVRDIFLPVNLGYSANLMASTVPPTTWTSSSVQMDIDLALYYCLRSLERGGYTIFLQV